MRRVEARASSSAGSEISHEIPFFLKPAFVLHACRGCVITGSNRQVGLSEDLAGGKNLKALAVDPPAGHDASVTVQPPHCFVIVDRGQLGMVEAERIQFEIDAVRDFLYIRHFRKGGPDLIAQDALHRPGLSGAFLKPGAVGAFDGFGADVMGDPVIAAPLTGVRKIEDPRLLSADNPGETSQIFRVRREITVRIPKENQVVESHEGGGLACLSLTDPPEFLLGINEASRFAGGHVDHGDGMSVPYQMDDASSAADDIIIRMWSDNKGLHGLLSLPVPPED
jgi:hypothetical protein